MKKVLYLPNSDRIHEEAAAWILRMESSNLGAQEENELRVWVSQSPLHLQILQDTAEVWDRMDIMAGLSELLPLERAENEEPSVKMAPKKITAFASLFLGVLFLGVIVSQWGSQTTEYETGVGRLDTVKLQDGSAITLNTATKLKTAITAEHRNIELVQGEAFFEVAHDPNKPFIVTAGNTRVEAIGTAFSVQLLGNEVEVAVTEGKVRVTRMTSSTEREQIAPAPFYMQGGEIVQIKPAKAEQIRTIKPEQIAQVLMWQQRMLVFNGQPLSDVISEFSRYTDTRIDITDQQTAAIRVGGYFRSDDLDGMLKSLKENFGIQIERASATQIVLSQSKK